VDEHVEPAAGPRRGRVVDLQRCSGAAAPFAGVRSSGPVTRTRDGSLIETSSSGHGQIRTRRLRQTAAIMPSPESRSAQFARSSGSRAAYLHTRHNERELIRERSQAGRELAKAAGRLGGRPLKVTPEKRAAALAMRERGELTMSQIAPGALCRAHDPLPPPRRAAATRRHPPPRQRARSVGKNAGGPPAPSLLSLCDRKAAASHLPNPLLLLPTSKSQSRRHRECRSAISKRKRPSPARAAARRLLDGGSRANTRGIAVLLVPESDYLGDPADRTLGCSNSTASSGRPNTPAFRIFESDGRQFSSSSAAAEILVAIETAPSPSRRISLPAFATRVARSHRCRSSCASSRVTSAAGKTAPCRPDRLRRRPAGEHHQPGHQSGQGRWASEGWGRAPHHDTGICALIPARFARPAPDLRRDLRCVDASDRSSVSRRPCSPTPVWIANAVSVWVRDTFQRPSSAITWRAHLPTLTCPLLLTVSAISPGGVGGERMPSTTDRRLTS
jgi:hypothetical protein